MDIDKLINPLDAVDGLIAEAHRQIAKDFIKNLTKEQALRVFEYFEKDVYAMQNYLTHKYSSFYMLWTPSHHRNVFIAEWITKEILIKITDNLEETP